VSFFRLAWSSLFCSAANISGRLESNRLVIVHLCDIAGGQRYAWEISAFVVYLTLLTIVALNVASDDVTYDQNAAIREAFSTRKALFSHKHLNGSFDDIASLDDWWDWAQVLTPINDWIH